jgi:transposase
MGKRRQHGAEFKVRVALEAAQGLKTVHAIAQEHQVHPVQVSQWKKELIERLPEVFGRKAGPEAEVPARRKERLERKTGELTMDVEFLKKKCGQLGIRNCSGARHGRAPEQLPCTCETTRPSPP